MLMVNALAGTGKTSTGVMGLGIKKPAGMVLSSEQKAIIKSMRGCRGSQAAMAFNKSISLELEKRTPPGCEVATANAFGHRAWARHVGTKLSLDGLKVRKQCRAIIGNDLSYKEKFNVEVAVDKLVSLCKCYLFDPTAEDATNFISAGGYTDGVGALKWLSQRFDTDFDPLIVDYAKQTFNKGIETKSYIDYNDQNFLPNYFGIKLPNYGHLLVDEVQDLNRAKMHMAFNMCEQMTAIGDRNQAIYGFSGADADAMDGMWSFMQSDPDALSLPLTVTRRCPKAVVRLANSIVPSLRCPEDAPEGHVEDIKTGRFLELLAEKPSMVICRVNAPLTSLAFKMIANGQRCYIQGRDIGAGIKAEIKRSGSNDIKTAIASATDRIEKKCDEIKTRPFADESQIEALQDKIACIRILSVGCDTTDDLYRKIDGLFKDSGGPNDTRLSSGHKSKGLEHERVFIYRADKLMLPSKQPFQRQQEKNLAYVMYTRSMNELYRVFPESDEVE